MYGLRKATWAVGTGVAALVMTAIAGCGAATPSTSGGDSATGHPRASASPSARPDPSPSSVLPTPWASASGTAAQQAAAVAALTAYNGMWQDLTALGATSDYKNPRMAAHMVAQPLTEWMQQFADNARQGVVDIGRPAWHPEVVSVTPPTQPTRVEIADCIDDSNWTQVYESSGEKVNGAAGERFRSEALVRFVPLTNSWMVTQEIFGKAGTC